MRKEKTNLPLNYITIKVTKSRIEKGLMAIPVSLLDLFPKSGKKIFLVDENGNEEVNSFTPYNSSSRECRIGGLNNFFQKYTVANNDELVVQLLDDGKYRILPENIFKKVFLNYLNEFEIIEDESISEEKLNSISILANITKQDILKNEFVRRSNLILHERKLKELERVIVKEGVPYSIRKILLELYDGKCQVTNYTFLMKNGKPYFEIHHIDSTKGNHFKNLIVVSANTHAQFTYANLEQKFDNEGWLREVKFNQEEYSVFQVINHLPKYFEKEVHY